MNLRYFTTLGLLLVASLSYAQVEEQVEIAVPVEAVPPSPPPPPPPLKRRSMDVIEDMPRFLSPECEKLIKYEANNCAQEKMLEFIYSNLQYPTMAKDSLVEGMVVINFLVLKDGTTSEARIVRDIGSGCGEEALRIINLMPKWIPGKQNEKAVASYLNLPVKFKLDKIKEED